MKASKERCCGRSMGIIYSILYSDIEKGMDSRGRGEILEGLYGPMSRSIRKMRGLRPGKGTVELLDLPMLLFLQWMKNYGSCSSEDRITPGDDKYGLVATFEGIQVDVGNFRRRGQAYDDGQSEDDILLPVFVGDEFQRFWKDDGGLRCPVPHGHPMCIVDLSQLLPYRFTEDAKSGISPHTLEPGTIWMRAEGILERTLSLLWLTGMIDFDGDRELLRLECPVLSSDPTPPRQYDGESKVVIIFGSIGSLDSEYYNLKGEDAFGRLDANGLNNTYVFEHDGMHIRHYRVLKDDAGNSNGRDLSGSIGERVIPNLLKDARDTDESGVKRTVVVVGRTDVEVALSIMKQCDSLGLTYDTARNLDEGGKMSLFFLKCAQLFRRERSASKSDGQVLRRLLNRPSKNSAIARSSSSDLGCTLDSEMSLSMQDGPDLIVT